MSIRKRQFDRHVRRFARGSIDWNGLPEVDDGHPSNALYDMGLKRHPVRAFESSECADGNCLGASRAFQEHLTKVGIHPGKVLHYADKWFDESDDSVQHFSTQHDVGGVPTVVDFTIRQFDRKAPFPLVEPRNTYDSRMSQLGLQFRGSWPD